MQVIRTWPHPNIHFQSQMKYFSFILASAVIFFASAQTPKKVNFSPKDYYTHFSAANPVVLLIEPGDVIYTSTIDAEGVDKAGIKRYVGEDHNPLVGPFFVKGAEEGDVLKVTFLDIKLNRSTAFCLPYFHGRSMPTDIVEQVKDNLKPSVIWDLDVKKNIAKLHHKTAHLNNFKVPLNPFLGCVGLAAPKGQEVPTVDAGTFGGNLDFSKVRKNASVYLPVYNKGGLLYLGDGHAAQGDGEINWTALETSLDIAFKVQLIKKPAKQIANPRIEDAEYIMTVALDLSLDNAIKTASKGMLDWLQEEYDLTIIEATQVMGSSLEYRIAEIVDPHVEIVAMIKKSVLKNIPKHKK